MMSEALRRVSDDVAADAHVVFMACVEHDRIEPVCADEPDRVTAQLEDFQVQTIVPLYECDFPVRRSWTSRRLQIRELAVSNRIGSAIHRIADYPSDDSRPAIPRVSRNVLSDSFQLDHKLCVWIRRRGYE